MKLDERYITTIQGREFVKYDGLLDLAHQKGLQRIEIKSLQLPNPENDYTAVCLASITTTNGETFVDIGDANPNNVNRKIVPHIIRMASTRAKARALRDYCNIGLVCVEELSDFDEVLPSGESNASAQRNGKGNKGNQTDSSPPMSEAQRRAIFNLAKRKKMSDEDLIRMVEQDFKLPLDQLTVQSASHLIQYLQNGN